MFLPYNFQNLVKNDFNFNKGKKNRKMQITKNFNLKPKMNLKLMNMQIY